MMAANYDHTGAICLLTEDYMQNENTKQDHTTFLLYEQTKNMVIPLII